MPTWRGLQKWCYILLNCIFISTPGCQSPPDIANHNGSKASNFSWQTNVRSPISQFTNNLRALALQPNNDIANQSLWKCFWVSGSGNWGIAGLYSYLYSASHSAFQFHKKVRLKVWKRRGKGSRENTWVKMRREVYHYVISCFVCTTLIT